MLQPLPLSLATALSSVIRPALHELLPAKYAGRDVEALLLAIGQQESGFAHRTQVGGPARGFWQFEQRGGVHGVLNHDATRLEARAVCLKRAVAPTDGDVYLALGHDDAFACALARLLIATDPAPLPKWGDAKAAADYYHRNWRPGAWIRDPEGLEAKFCRGYLAALRVVCP